VVWRDVHFLVDGTSNQTNTLRPGEIEKVSEPTEEPDADLVSSHAELVQLCIDHGGLLFKVCHWLCSGALHDGSHGEVGLGGQFELIVDGHICRVARGLFIGVEVVGVGLTGHDGAFEHFVGAAAIAHGKSHPCESVSILSHSSCK